MRHCVNWHCACSGDWRSRLGFRSRVSKSGPVRFLTNVWVKFFGGADTARAQGTVRYVVFGRWQHLFPAEVWDLWSLLVVVAVCVILQRCSFRWVKWCTTRCWNPTWISSSKNEDDLTSRQAIYTLAFMHSQQHIIPGIYFSVVYLLLFPIIISITRSRGSVRVVRATIKVNGKG